MTLREQTLTIEGTEAHLGSSDLRIFQGENVVAEFAREHIAGWRVAPGEEIKK